MHRLFNSSSSGSCSNTCTMRFLIWSPGRSGDSESTADQSERRWRVTRRRAPPRSKFLAGSSYSEEVGAGYDELLRSIAAPSLGPSPDEHPPPSSVSSMCDGNIPVEIDRISVQYAIQTLTVSGDFPTTAPRNPSVPQNLFTAGRCPDFNRSRPREYSQPLPHRSRSLPCNIQRVHGPYPIHSPPLRLRSSPSTFLRHTHSAINILPSPAAILYDGLCVVDTSLAESISNFRSFIHSSSRIAAARNLRGKEAQRLIDLIDQVSSG